MSGIVYGEEGDTISEGVRVTATFSGPAGRRVVEVDSLPYMAEPNEDEQFVLLSIEGPESPWGCFYID